MGSRLSSTVHSILGVGKISQFVLKSRETLDHNRISWSSQVPNHRGTIACLENLDHLLVSAAFPELRILVKLPPAAVDKVCVRLTKYSLHTIQ